MWQAKRSSPGAGSKDGLGVKAAGLGARPARLADGRYPRGVRRGPGAGTTPSTALGVRVIRVVWRGPARIDGFPDRQRPGRPAGYHRPGAGSGGDGRGAWPGRVDRSMAGLAGRRRGSRHGGDLPGPAWIDDQPPVSRVGCLRDKKEDAKGIKKGTTAMNRSPGTCPGGP